MANSILATCAMATATFAKSACGRSGFACVMNPLIPSLPHPFLMKLDIDRVPANLDQAIEIVVAGLEVVELELIREAPPEAVHHALGRPLRSAWSLWESETVLVRWFINNLRVGHADDLSGIILDGVWARVRNLPFNPQPIAERKRKHWRELGCDPITGGLGNRGNDDS